MIALVMDIMELLAEISNFHLIPQMVNIALNLMETAQIVYMKLQLRNIQKISLLMFDVIKNQHLRHRQINIFSHKEGIIQHLDLVL